MKLARFGAVGEEIPAVVDDAGGALDARSVTADYDPEFFADGGIARLRDAARSGELPRLDTSELRVGAPLRRSGKIICIGLNYRNHALESGMEIPSEPVVFMKAPNTLVGPNERSSWRS
jgi:2-keto-4-pentenoate hydratase/2-oxohepta-3-ene-1,7-dioic acid hydratase in catechol pathway